MSAIFPHRAVTERYLHTGGTGGSSRKAVIAAFLGGLGCAVVVANLPAGSLTFGPAPAASEAALKNADSCKERAWPYNRCADPVAHDQMEKTPTRTVTADQPPPAADSAPPPVQVTASAETKTTTGISQGSTQPNTRPQAEIPAPPAPVTPQNMPASRPAEAIAAGPPATLASPPPATAASPPAAALRKAVLAENVADEPAPRVTKRKVANRQNLKQRRAEQGIRAASRRQQNSHSCRRPPSGRTGCAALLHSHCRSAQRRARVSTSPWRPSRGVGA